MTWPRSIARSLPPRKACCSSAKRKRKRRCSAPRGGAMSRPERPIPGWSAPRQWSITFTPTAWIGTLALSSLKFCTYFPYNAKLCLNGHEYVKQQLTNRGISYEALDNGILSCDDPKRVQALCDGLSGEKIDGLLRKWFRKLPHPFTGKDRQAGYRYQISMLQAEFSLTQVLDRPVTGRVFFEEVIRENLDIGRPDQVQLIFDRRVTRRTPGHFRTRVLTDGVVPSLHVDYKHSRIKQYHKAGRALRTETTINDAGDFGLRKGLSHLSALRKVGFQANRRLLDVQRISHDCAIGEAAFVRLSQPVRTAGQRAPSLRFAD